MIVFLTCASALAVVYLYLKYHFGYWARKEVPFTQPELLFGNMGDTLRLKCNLPFAFNKLYNDHPDAELVGFFKMMKPAILIRSPELLRSVMVQDFDHFQSNDFEAGAHDKIASRNTALQEGVKWKTTRQRITPAFTSGKLKNMLPMTLKAASNMIEYIGQNSSLSNADGFDGRDLFSRYTTDNAASSAFGLEVNSFSDLKNEFHTMSRNVFPADLMSSLRVLVIMLSPALSRIFKLKFFAPKVTDYFSRIISETLDYRKNNKVERKDFVDMMSQLRVKHGEEEFGHIDVIAQAIAFFANGAEGSATNLVFNMYNLSKHLDVQERLQEEIDRVTASHDGQVTYEGIQEMTYLDQVFNETLRIFPTALSLLKRCTKPYTLPSTSNSKKLNIEVGTTLAVSILGLHMDEKYFPNPQVFDPERFNETNKPNIPKFTYMPFGEGPRLCLGQRFAVLQAKVGIASILKDFNVRLNDKTVQPIQHDPKQFLYVPKDGVYFNFHKRTLKL